MCPKGGGGGGTGMEGERQPRAGFILTSAFLSPLPAFVDMDMY